MKNYVKELTEWLAQRLIARATQRAIEMIEDGDREQAPKALPAPRLPEIELH